MSVFYLTHCDTIITNSTRNWYFSTCNTYIIAYVKTQNKWRYTIHYVAGISKTGLNDNNCELYNLNVYKLVETHRSLKKRSGVGIFIKKCIPYIIRNDLVSEESIFESLFIEIDKQVFQQRSSVILGIIHRPLNTDINSFNDALFMR